MAEISRGEESGFKAEPRFRLSGSGLRPVRTDVRSDLTRSSGGSARQRHRNHGDRIPTVTAGDERSSGRTPGGFLQSVTVISRRDASANLFITRVFIFLAISGILSRLQTCTCRSFFRSVIKQVKIQQTERRTQGKKKEKSVSTAAELTRSILKLG